MDPARSRCVSVWQEPQDRCLQVVTAMGLRSRKLGDALEMAQDPGVTVRRVRTVLLLLAPRACPCGFSLLLEEAAGDPSRLGS